MTIYISWSKKWFDPWPKIRVLKLLNTIFHNKTFSKSLHQSSIHHIIFSYPISSLFLTTLTQETQVWQVLNINHKLNRNSIKYCVGWWRCGTCWKLSWRIQHISFKTSWLKVETQYNPRRWISILLLKMCLNINSNSDDKERHNEGRNIVWKNDAVRSCSVCLSLVTFVSAFITVRKQCLQSQSISHTSQTTL